jgi:DNA replication protein DnaC
MLIQPTLHNMKALRLFGMACALESQLDMPDSTELSFEARLGLLVDAELVDRNNRRTQSRLRFAKLRLSACIEDLDLKASRGLDRANITALAECSWIAQHQNVLITGATGAGKTYLACALAQKACRNGYSASYHRAPRLFEELAIAKADGRYAKILATLRHRDLLVIDDFGLTAFTDEQRRDLLELVEDRYDRKSTIIASQLPVDHWYESIGDATLADAIMDRLVHNAHKLNLKGESMRKPTSSQKEKEPR